MSKRAPQFERHARDHYPTPEEAVWMLRPFLDKSMTFYEPCAADGNLAIAIRQIIGCRCTGMSDIEPLHYAVVRRDALTLREVEDADVIVTNPPWERELMHQLIDHLRWLAPTWLLIDSDWLFTKQAAEYIADITDVVPIGRLKWIAGSKSKGKDNACWLRFVGGHDEGPTFHPNW